MKKILNQSTANQLMPLFPPLSARKNKPIFNTNKKKENYFPYA